MRVSQRYIVPVGMTVAEQRAQWMVLAQKDFANLVLDKMGKTVTGIICAYWSGATPNWHSMNPLREEIVLVGEVKA